MAHNKKRYAFTLATMFTFVSYLAFRAIEWLVPVENQFAFIAAYAFGSGTGAIAALAMYRYKKNFAPSGASRRTFIQ